MSQDKKRYPNIEYTVKHHLCLGCGLCVDACPTHSISIHEVNGEYKPKVNTETCINEKGCHRCSMTCPGLGIDLKAIGEQNFQDAEYQKTTGFYLSSYSGYSLDEKMRFHGASGGLLTAFLAFLLDKEYISAAVVANNDLSSPFLNQTVLVHSSKELYQARSSKYCPVKFDTIVSQVKKEEGMVVIVGLPCIMHGFRKYEKIDPSFKKKILAHIGLYCSCGRSFNLTEYVFKKNKIDKSSLSYFQYRDEGCLGSLVATDNQRTVRIPFQLYYHPLRSFFIPQRCQVCIDHFAELADIAFGDIHYGEYKNDTVGVNSVLVRKPEMDKLLKECAEAGYAKIEGLDYDTLVKCQRAVSKKKGRVGGVLKFRKALGKVNPHYDVEITRFSYPKSILYYLFAKSQMFVGKRRWLWWLIPLFTKKGKIR